MGKGPGGLRALAGGVRRAHEGVGGGAAGRSDSRAMAGVGQPGRAGAAQTYADLLLLGRIAGPCARRRLGGQACRLEDPACVVGVRHDVEGSQPAVAAGTSQGVDVHAAAQERGPVEARRACQEQTVE